MARRVHVALATVGKWRQRFVLLRVDGLLDEPRPGTPRRLSDAAVERVLARTLESQPQAATHWSTRSLAQATGLSQSSISRIWRAFSLRPHRSQAFKLSRDPRAILRKHRMWGNIQPDVKMLRTREDAGKALTQEEETALLKECRESRSRSLFVVVLMALDTCMRYSEVRLLQWSQIDFAARELRVGSSKTEHGDNRVIPISQRLHVVLEFWAGIFPQRKPGHFVFPFEKCGGRGKDKLFGFKGAVAYATEPTQPTGDWKEAWEHAKRRAGAALNPGAKNPKPLVCRFHDLRHTGCTRMLEKGVPFSVAAVIMGWSASTAVRMAKRYSHIGHAARVEAIDKLASATVFDSEGARKWAQSSRAKKASGWAQKWVQPEVGGFEQTN